MILDWASFTAYALEAACEFRRTFDLPVADPGALCPAGGNWRIRQALISEGRTELDAAIKAANLSAVADALACLSYSIAGTAVVYGIPGVVFRQSYGPVLRSEREAVKDLAQAPSLPALAILLAQFDTAYGHYRAQSTGGGPIDGRTLARMLHAVACIAVACGIPLGVMVEEIHLSNMTKSRPADMQAGSDGKLVKGTGYTPPNLAAALTAYHVVPIVRGLLASSR